MPGLRSTGHEPEFPRRLTLERVTGNTEFFGRQRSETSRALAADHCAGAWG
jgi:hypothetical protein